MPGHGSARPWWKDAVFYQVYPRSFADSDADGSGDLAGLISRLDWLNDGKGGGLGVDALWVCPFYPSPNRDWGYDVSDYCAIAPDMGRMEDFERLIREAHARGIRVILDLVLNHSSDEHSWFKEARRSREDPRHDWYLWTPMRGKKRPNNWKCLFTLRNAWVPNPATGEWFLGTFTPFQPEFNWRNPQLREAMMSVLRFWLDRGADGFRLDVCTAYLKDPQLRSNPFSPRLVPELLQQHIYDRNQEEVHGIFRQMRTVADEYPGDRVLVGEVHGHDPVLAASCHGRIEGQRGDELDMAFNFDFLMQPWSAKAFRRSAEAWYASLPEGAWPNFCLGNHDQCRISRRYRSRLPGRAGISATEARLRVLAAMLLTLKGTPFVYYGDEIGMDSRRLPRRVLRDPLGKNTWPLAFLGRDPERTPMQWDSSPGAGFGSSKPWLPLNPDWKRRNAAAQATDSDSLLAWYKALLRLRRGRQELLSGDIRFLKSPAGILSYERYGVLGEGPVRVILSFRGMRTTAMELPPCRVLLASRRTSGERLYGKTLVAPLEVLIVAVEVRAA